MCWQCDHPDATDADYRNEIARKIVLFGHAVQGVEGDGLHPPWAYTVGRTSAGHPELVVTGMPPEQAAVLLSQVACLQENPGMIVPGARITMRQGTPGEYAVQVIEVMRPWAHLNVAVEFYGRDIAALQLVHADPGGRWPWNAGFASSHGPQPVLGEAP